MKFRKNTMFQDRSRGKSSPADP